MTLDSPRRCRSPTAPGDWLYAEFGSDTGPRRALSEAGSAGSHTLNARLQKTTSTTTSGAHRNRRQRRATVQEANHPCFSETVGLKNLEFMNPNGDVSAIPHPTRSGRIRSILGVGRGLPRQTTTMGPRKPCRVQPKTPSRHGPRELTVGALRAGTPVMWSRARTWAPEAGSATVSRRASGDPGESEDVRPPRSLAWATGSPGATRGLLIQPHPAERRNPEQPARLHRDVAPRT